MSEERSPGRMTLAFHVEALKRLQDPAGTVHAAKRWSESVGVVADDREDANFYVSLYGVTADFVEESPSEEEFVELKEGFDTDRHVVVGTSEVQERAVNASGWEFLSLEDAAEKADWEIRRDETSWISAVVDRLFRWFMTR